MWEEEEDAAMANFVSDCLSWSIVGCHSTTTKSYSGETVYVVNTWNHMLDTSDTNTSLSKVAVP